MSRHRPARLSTRSVRPLRVCLAYGDPVSAKVTTAWGAAALVDEIELPQAADGKDFASLVQLLEDADGARFVRFAYTTDGKARRGPVTLRAEDVARLASALAEHPELAAALALERRRKGRGGGGGRSG